MKLIMAEQAEMLQQQHAIYANSELADLMVPVKLFALNSSWTWYLLTQDPEDPDYLWVIVDGFAVEMGSVSLSELESIRHMGIPAIERDMYYEN